MDSLLTPAQVAASDQAHSQAGTWLDGLVESMREIVANESAEGLNLGASGVVAVSAVSMLNAGIADTPPMNVALLIAMAAYRLASAPTSLPERTRSAAAVLEEVAQAGYTQPHLALWSAESLRVEAGRLEAEAGS